VHSDKGSECSDSPCYNKIDTGIDMDTGMGLGMDKDGKMTWKMNICTPEADTKNSCVLTPAHAMVVRTLGGGHVGDVPVAATVKATLLFKPPTVSFADWAYESAPALFLASFMLLLFIKVQ
jgi:hypothetical protein